MGQRCRGRQNPRLGRKTSASELEEAAHDHNTGRWPGCYAQVNVWSVVYRASGFVGAVTLVGPDASEKGAKNLASQAYAFAAQSLH